MNIDLLNKCYFFVYLMFIALEPSSRTFSCFYRSYICTMEPRYNEPLNNEVPDIHDIKNDILQPDQSYTE